MPGRHGFSRIRNQFEEALWVLLGLGALLSAASSASAASLLLARGLTRRREFAVRLAIGASRARILRQCLVETAVWTGIGATVGLLLASWSASALVAAISTWQEPIELDVSPNARTVAFALALALLGAWISAVPFAIAMTRRDVTGGLRNAGDQPSRRQWSWGSVLVTGQVALTIVLLAGAALFVTSLRRTMGQDAGFDRDRTLVVTADAVGAGYTDGRQIPFYNDLRDRLARLPGVESASLSWYPPISDQDGHWSQTVAIEGDARRTAPGQSVYFNAVSPGYFSTIGMRLLAGRDITARDAAGATRVAVVNEAFLRRFFPAGDALGRRISIGLDPSRQDLEIVGLVSDARYQRLEETPHAIAYLPTAQLTALLADATLVAEVRAAGPLSAVAARVTQEVAALDRRVPVRVESIADRIDDSLVTERIVARLSTALGAAALALAVAAVYGLLACTVARRRKEIGIRVALGAGRAALLWMVVRQSLLLALVGAGLGLAMALALGRFVRTLLFQVQPSDPFALAMATFIGIAATVAAAFVPARRAARVDPLVAIRQE
jgi:predicted permease